jgi:hypothetical protein
VNPVEALKFRLSYSHEEKDGNKITYGPIGDRPPRSLNIQMTEPIDYVTREVKFEAEYNRSRFQSLFTYLISDFENEIDTLRWQNIYARTTGADPSYDQWAGHRVTTFGQRALAPDNRYQNASLSVGVDLPMSSRLAATAAYGKMEQDESLLPYSTSSFGTSTLGAARALPRTKADAEIETMLFNLDYTVKPVAALTLRPFYRFYELDNKTTQSDWWYISNDAIPGNAAATPTNATYKNKRTNLAYAYDQQNYGLDASYSLAFLRTTLGLGYEREEIDRDFREADTDENILKASLSLRPADWLSIKAKYLFGDREADNYNGNVTAASYWYAAGEQGTDRDNPKFTFANHPDTRKFDVSDRERNQFNISTSVMPLESLDLTASYAYRKDDFDMGNVSSQPLQGVPTADPLAVGRVTPGDQLGLLDVKTQRYALDGSFAPTERLTLTAFASREEIDQRQRGLEFNENNKENPNGVDAGELGPWNRQAAQWLAKSDDRTNTFGVGGQYEIVPNKLRLSTDFTLARGKVDIEYSGMGAVYSVDNAGAGIVAGQTPMPDNYEFAFRNPPTVKHNQITVNASLEYQLVENLTLGLHYLFDRYKISDWSQETDTPWFESVGSEYLLRDTTASQGVERTGVPKLATQWGNRLVNMGSYLGGGDYEAHVGYLTATYKF